MAQRSINAHLKAASLHSETPGASKNTFRLTWGMSSFVVVSKIAIKPIKRGIT